MTELKPDIQIPQDDRHELENLIIREYSARTFVLTKDGQQAAGEAEQCMINVNELLDHHPNGVHRELARTAVQIIDKERKAA